METNELCNFQNFWISAEKSNIMSFTYTLITDITVDIYKFLYT